MKDPYQVLGISRSASETEIKKAYRTQCKRWHPDLNPNDPTAEEHFKEVQEAYDAIMKGGQSAGTSGGYRAGGSTAGYGTGTYGASGSYGYGTGAGSGSYTGWDDPFGFGDIFGAAFGGGYSGYGTGYAGSSAAQDTPEMQAARRFLANGRYPEARRVLDGIGQRTARWYYYSALANQGLGRQVDAMADARRACEMEPGNMEYRSLYNRMQGPGGAYRTRSQTYGAPSGLGRWCLTMFLLNLVCQIFSGGCCRGMYFGPGYYM